MPEFWILGGLITFGFISTMWGFCHELWKLTYLQKYAKKHNLKVISIGANVEDKNQLLTYKEDELGISTRVNQATPIMSSEEMIKRWKKLSR